MDLLGLRLLPSLPGVCDSAMAIFSSCVCVWGGTEAPVPTGWGLPLKGGTDLLFGLFCRLLTEQETHLSTEREMSPTWLL